ncbi:MAG: hypothetical protein OXR66_04955 [Candidatus Woesearchaeota archaeon]|nr:hypothetical protein [Candidatus Woesearchaeota archaeon]
MEQNDIVQAVEEAVQVKNHLEKDHTDKCGYCGQSFGPDDVVIEKELYGRKWVFCDDECYQDFQEKSNFADEDLDGEKDGVRIDFED